MLHLFTTTATSYIELKSANPVASMSVLQLNSSRLLFCGSCYRCASMLSLLALWANTSPNNALNSRPIINFSHLSIWNSFLWRLSTFHKAVLLHWPKGNIYVPWRAWLLLHSITRKVLFRPNSEPWASLSINTHCGARIFCSWQFTFFHSEVSLAMALH